MDYTTRVRFSLKPKGLSHEEEVEEEKRDLTDKVQVETNDLMEGVQGLSQTGKFSGNRTFTSHIIVSTCQHQLHQLLQRKEEQGSHESKLRLKPGLNQD